MTDQIEWGDPPDSARRSKWGPVLAEFRKRPGEWGKVAGRHSPTTATNVKRGYMAGSTAGEFEAKATDQADHKADIWIRYVGEVTS